MTNVGSMSRLVEQLRGNLTAPTDGALLSSFIDDRDAAALEQLVRRHAAMVWSVCRRLLPNDHDAEDAFQTTFLVLVRRAGSICPRSHVGNWLYGVAQQTALKARATSARRRERERHCSEFPDVPEQTAQTENDHLVLLVRELGGLPAKYRLVVVLSDLEGKTRKEVARELGLAEGTVASRLARARALLARRLSRCGVAVGGTTLLAGLASAGGVPAPLLATTLASTASVARDPTALLPERLSTLTETMLRVTRHGKRGLWTGLGAFIAALGLTFASLPGPDPPAAFAPHAAPRRDRDRLQGVWRAVEVVVRGDTLTFGPNEGPLYAFARERVAVIHAPAPLGRTTDADALRWRFRRPAPWPVDASILQQFGGRGGPWAGLDAAHRRLLLDRVRVAESAALAVEFEYQLQEETRALDRFLRSDDATLIVRGVYELGDDTLLLWEGAPMQERPNAQQRQTGASCTRWRFKRIPTAGVSP